MTAEEQVTFDWIVGKMSNAFGADSGKSLTQGLTKFQALTLKQNELLISEAIVQTPEDIKHGSPGARVWHTISFEQIATILMGLGVTQTSTKAQIKAAVLKVLAANPGLQPYVNAAVARGGL